MIEVSRLNGKNFILNCELIKTIESTPDTLITLTSNEKMMVKESVESIIRQTIEYRRQLFQDLPTMIKSKE